MNRISLAVAYFVGGYNCAQAVAMAYAPEFGLDAATAARAAGGYGGGTGGLRAECGAWNATVMIAGLARGYDKDKQGDKGQFYALVRSLHDRFVARAGSDNCTTLLSNARVKIQQEPSPRTAEYYATRPCVRYVEIAAEILEEEFFGGRTAKEDV